MELVTLILAEPAGPTLPPAVQPLRNRQPVPDADTPDDRLLESSRCANGPTWRKRSGCTSGAT